MYILTFIERIPSLYCQAKGDAEAELAIMNQLGIFDAILTKDSDAFSLGAQCVMKVVP